MSLRVGDRVRVRSVQEILLTLDGRSSCEGVPFMPEMVRYCGRELVVFKRIDKVNDTVDRTGLRRMRNAVTLEGVRCSGEAHGDCQALCQIIWKEAWLSKVDARGAGSVPTPAAVEARLLAATRRGEGSEGERFACQATEIKSASSRLAWWDVRQDVRDLRSGNVTVREVAGALGFWLFTRLLRVGGFRVLEASYNWVQRCRGGAPYASFQGRRLRTPTLRLDLRPGEMAQVKSLEEIVDTLDRNNRNRGLWFDVEMVKYCGGVFRVLRRVERIVDHKTGRMINLSSDCVILEGVTTRGDYHRFYPQNEYPFWREIWLRRVPGPVSSGSGTLEGAGAQESR